jgi:hypothetical protein
MPPDVGDRLSQASAAFAIAFAAVDDALTVAAELARADLSLL